MGKHHSASDRGKVQLLRNEGYSQSVIAKKTGIPLGTVKMWCVEMKDSSNFETKRRPKPKGNWLANRTGMPIISVHDKKKIATYSGQHPRVSQRKLVPKLPQAIGVTASRSTIARVLKNYGLKNLHRARKPALTTAMKRKRVVFAKANLDRDWSLVLSADEVEVSLDSGQNTHNSVYWAKATAKVPPLRTHKFPTSRRYFVAVSIHGALEPVEYFGHLDSQSYQQLLEQAMETVNEIFGGHEWVYLHDSAPYHTSNDTQEWLETAVPLFFTKSEWPGQCTLKLCLKLFTAVCCRKLA
jgi:transposase